MGEKMKIKLKKAYHMDTFANKMSALVINSTPRSMATADKVKLYNNIRDECWRFCRECCYLERLAFVSAMRQEYGFAQKRINRVADSAKKILQDAVNLSEEAAAVYLAQKLTRDRINYPNYDDPEEVF